MIIPPNMEHQKLTLRGCLGLIVFTLSLLIGFWLVVKFDMCPFRVTGEGTELGNRSYHRGIQFSAVSNQQKVLSKGADALRSLVSIAPIHQILLPFKRIEVLRLDTEPLSNSAEM